jgi:hypothetical protein
MKKPSIQCLALLLFLFIHLQISFAQGTGYIVRQATSAGGRAVLDPDNLTDGSGYHYSSLTTGGFAGNDVTNSELPFKPVKAFSTEPYGDLRRGPSHLFTDFVPDSSGNGYYAYYDGTNLLFRFRMGSLIPGSKGYSVLIDTDGKFGATGANADPNYMAATTGTNGNPGFEIEVVLESNFRIAIYNVDGTGSSVSPTTTYTNWQDYSQVSVAGTYDNGDPDFFLDFYIPFSALQAAPFNLTTSTSLRMIATTVMSPQGSVGGPKSDIYGMGDSNYPLAADEYTAFINAQSPLTVSGVSGAGTTAVGTMCTAAPVVTTVTTGAGTGSVQGTWTKGLSGASGTATITVYKAGSTLIGTVSNVSTGGSWTLSNVTITAGDVITAKAAGSGEVNTCYTSNAVTAASCTKPAPVSLTCVANKGADGTGYIAASGDYISLWRVTSSGNVHISHAIPASTPSSTGFALTGVGTGWTYSGGCSGNGNAGLPPGQYIAYDSTVTGCISSYTFFCNANNAGGKTYAASPAVAITSPVNIYPTTTTLSGTCGSGTAIVRVYLDSVLLGNATITGGTTWSYSLSGVSLSVGQTVRVSGQQADAGNTYYCTTAVSSTVKCSTSAPVITADASNKVGGGLPITGISGEPAGSTIKVYNTTNTTTPIATVTVQSGGTWTTGATTAVSGQSYYATATNGSCSESVASFTVTSIAATSSSRCGSITTSGITSATTAIQGTLATAVASTTVNLYIDGYLIGSSSTGTTSWGPVDVTGKLYANGVLTIGIQETASTEVICGTSATVGCTAPTQPVVTPTSTSINQNQSQTYTITNPVAGVFYGIADATTGQSLATGVWATSASAFDITTNTITAAGSVTVVIKATSLSSTEMCGINSTSRTLTVNTVLPLLLLDFKGKKSGEGVWLEWQTTSELNTSHFEIERSSNGVQFDKIGERQATNTTQAAYNFTDNSPSTVNYYRLKIVNQDGKYFYSKVIIINKDGRSLYLNVIRPNPFTGQISICILMSENQKLEVQLLDEAGRKVKERKLSGVQGTNTILFNDLNTLVEGLYIVKVRVNDEVLVQKLLKVKSY